MTSAAPSALFPALRRSALIGLAFGAVAVHLAVVGVLLMLHQRAIIVGTLSLGQAVLLLIAAGAGLIAARGERSREAVLCGMLAGAASGLPIAALTVLIGFVPLRSIFIALSPALFDMLSFGQTLTVGVAILIAGGAIAGLLGAGLRLCPPGLRRAVIPGLTAVVICGVFQELIQLMLQQYEGIVGDIRDFIYSWEGLTPEGAAACFAGAVIPGLTAVVICGVFQELIQLMLQQYEGIVGDIRDFIYSWEGLTPEGAAACFAGAAFGGVSWNFLGRQLSARG